MEYTTQMDAAKKGIVTKEMKTVAEKENVTVEYLMEEMKLGHIVIPANKNHKSISAEGIGKGLRTKINVNLGISRDCLDVDKELEKVKKAIDMKVEAIMDLSSYGKTEEFREKLIGMSPAMIGTVPVYDAVGFLDKDLKSITKDEFIRVIEEHAKNGVDFITIHSGLTRAIGQKIKNRERLANIVSRGGSLLFAWMELNKEENPFYSEFDRILDICEKYDVTISLGDACRPGCIDDSTDGVQVQELVNLGELARRARQRNVQVMIEGPGHMAINEVTANVLMEKRICDGAPFYVLGPIVTDIAPGYDHITSAIGGALAASAGVDFLCYVTPAEHLRLPNKQDMIDGIIATKIAAHAGDLGKGIKGARDWDNEMSKARVALDWEKQFSLAIDEEKARRYRAESTPEHKDSCTMCGKMCSARTVNRILNGEDVSLI